MIRLLKQAVEAVLGIAAALVLFWVFILAVGVLVFGYDGPGPDARTFIFWSVVIVLGLLVSGSVFGDEQPKS